MTITDLDLFDPATDEPAMPYGLDEDLGRYVFPPPPGHAPGWRNSWQRCTNLVGAFADQYALGRWRERKIMEGVRLRPGLALELRCEDLDALEKRDRERILNEYAGDFADAAGASDGAKAGTARHELAEGYFLNGVMPEPAGDHAWLTEYEALLESHGLEVEPGTIERHVCLPELGVVGRIDKLVRDRRTGELFVLDLKSQRKFYSWQVVAGQQAVYANAPWWWEGPLNDDGGWARKPKVNTSWAILAHIPVEVEPGRPLVELVKVDLAYGLRVARHAYEGVELRAQGARKTNPMGFVMKLPEAVASQPSSAVDHG